MYYHESAESNLPEFPFPTSIYIILYIYIHIYIYIYYVYIYIYIHGKVISFDLDTYDSL